MRQASFLKITTGTRNELDGGRRRGVLPFVMATGDGGDDAAENKWREFSLKEAIAFRIYLDLTRGGMNAAEAQNFVGNGIDRIERGEWDGEWGNRVSVQPERDLLAAWDAEEVVWIARETYTADYVAGFKSGLSFSTTWWGGTRDEVEAAIAKCNAGDRDNHRETLSIQFYNVTKARREVIAAALALNLPEAADVEAV